MKFHLGKFSQGKIGYTGKRHFLQGNLIFTSVKLRPVTTAMNGVSL